MINFESIQTEFTDKITTKLSVEALSLIVDGLKNHAALKGRQFNCLVLNRGETKEADELTVFLSQLKKELPNLANGRVQVIFKDKMHWSTFDLEIKEGKLDFYLVDAANSIPEILSAITAIHSILPQATLTYSGLAFQMDTEHCAYFALENAFNLAKIDTLHEQLPSCVEKGPLGHFSSYADYIGYLIDNEAVKLDDLTKDEVLLAVGTLNYIPAANLPKNFGSLMKINQNMPLYKTFYMDKGYVRHNNKPLTDYVQSHLVTHVKSMYHPPSERNGAIEVRKERLKALGLKRLEELGVEYTTVVNARNKLLGPLKVSAKEADLRRDNTIVLGVSEETLSLADKLIVDDELLNRFIPLHKAINTMRAHGVHIAKTDKEKGLLAIELADKLSANVTAFIKANAEKPKDSIDFVSFAKQSKQLLNDKDSAMGTHRHYWKVIIANIAIALSLVGSLLIGKRSVDAGKLVLFFDKTQRQKNSDAVHLELDHLSSP